MATKLPPVGNASPAEPVARTRAASATAPASAVDAAKPVASVEAAAAARAAEQVERAASVGAVAPAAAVSRAAPADLIKNVAERLRRGQLTPAQAVEELIEDAVRLNLPGVSDDSPLRQELRALLKSYAKDDPFLFTRTKGLGSER